MRKSLALLSLTFFMLFIAACGDVTQSVKSDVTEPSVGVNFKLGKQTYALEKWVRRADYDTDTKTGYGLCFLQVEGVAPISISASGEYSSTLDMTLDIGDTALRAGSISFAAVDDIDYATRITFIFALPKGSALPVNGTISNTGNDERKTINLSELSAPDEETEQVTTLPADDYYALKLCGNWQLSSIIFRTPEADNGIFTIDATMDVSEGFEYGLNLKLSEDWTLSSDIDLDSLTEAVDELPFSTDGLDLSKYTSWSYTNELFTPAPAGPALTAAVDKQSGELSLTWSGNVNIGSTDANGGTVALDITLIFTSKP